ncbi:MAG: hypothetical protein GY898_32405 [Proteobacteria bacterium]|nr:hypothetical protein [Pseudomonadota bacterium]
MSLGLGVLLAGCPPVDADGDGWDVEEDCDDEQPLVYPNAPEACNGLDDDCDSIIDDGFDVDLDGHTDAAACADGTDCDDADGEINPDADELCDGIDNDCDEGVDEDLALVEWCVDTDGDGVGGDDSTEVCDEEAPAGYVECDVVPDCDDEDGTSFPGGTELCDDVDHDCDGDPTNDLDANEYWEDADGDGYGAGAVLVDCAAEAPTGFVDYVEDDEDCDDDEEDVNPAETEVCDGADTDCSGVIDDTVDADTDGFFDCDDCDDDNIDVNPDGIESCNGIDDDCDGVADEDTDDDLDGFTTCGTDGIPGNTDDDCNDNNGDTYPLAPEICDGEDNDCNGSLPSEELDGDTDGYPECLECDDSNAAINPGATEVCDGLDTDCDGSPAVDEVDVDIDLYLACVDFVANGAIGILGGDDCNDADDTINPAAVETCDGVDEDCDGIVDGDFDADNDGFSTCGADGIPGNEDDDCNDLTAQVNPSALELCDYVDNDCDTLVDADDTADFAGTDFDNDNDAGIGCGGSDCDDNDATVDGLNLDRDGFSSCNGDCDDSNAYIAPDQTESCNGVDTNCDGLVDDTDPTFTNDHDGDGHVTSGCGEGGDDCDDDDHHVFPDPIYTSGVNAECAPPVRPGFFSDLDYARISLPSYFVDPDTGMHYIYYRGHHDQEAQAVFVSSSADAVTWTKEPSALLEGLEDTEWDDRNVSNPSVIKLDEATYARPYVMAYHARASVGGDRSVGIATATDPLGPFERLDPLTGAAAINDPVLAPSTDGAFLDSGRTLHPTLWYDATLDRVHCWYSARQTSPNTLRVFHAVSDDGGMTWVRTSDGGGPIPVMSPTEAWHTSGGAGITQVTVVEDADLVGEFDFWFTGGSTGVGAAHGDSADAVWTQDIVDEVLEASSSCTRLDGYQVSARGIRHDTATDTYHWYYGASTDIEATYDTGTGEVTPGSEVCTDNGDSLFFRNNGGLVMSYVAEGTNTAPEVTAAAVVSGTVDFDGTVTDTAPDTVTITLTNTTDDSFLGTVTPDATGNTTAGLVQTTTWSITGVAVPSGTHDIEVSAVDEAGTFRSTTVQVVVP